MYYYRTSLAVPLWLVVRVAIEERLCCCCYYYYCAVLLFAAARSRGLPIQLPYNTTNTTTVTQCEQYVA